MLLSGCASTHVALVGAARPPISPDQVQVYLEPPRGPYVEIANLSASSRGSFAITSPAKIDIVMQRLKNEAAKLGANGILMHGVGHEAAGKMGAQIDVDGDTGHSPYGVGFGTSAFLLRENGDGVAIYIEPR
jgi:hypothetical protein